MTGSSSSAHCIIIEVGIGSNKHDFFADRVAVFLTSLMDNYLKSEKRTIVQISMNIVNFLSKILANIIWLQLRIFQQSFSPFKEPGQHYFLE